MNVLILTPDRVGSTLLQRLITVYMTAHVYDQPVINLHELTNGLIKYYSPTFNQEVLGKPNEKNSWGYYQTLPEIVELLSSTDHYKTSRLAQYHIRNRQDSLADQLPFYQYLNDNFFIIAAERESLLEHALSWCINLESKRLNVYSHSEKVATFAELYQHQITVDAKNMIKYLDRYVDYLKWVDCHFNVNSYFKYDEDLPRIEEYILGLNIFNGQNNKTWKDIFNIEFKDWNLCHYLISDLSGISSQLAGAAVPLLENKTEQPQYQLASVAQNKIPSSLSPLDQKFLLENKTPYVKTYQAINELVDNKVLVTGVPIKLQTMLEKRLLIKSFKECVDVYNDWAARTGHGQVYTEEDIDRCSAEEIKQYHNLPRLT